ncbi:MAG TPA: translocation/assembly module TamB domain-containing protein, partial [Gammaproteobacteria bacterium]|nr:translocation/assembly module TamB domain-containing protein [Gammaproteobacteria bacterium]
MKRRTRWLLGIPVVVLLVLVAGAWVLLDTHAGMRWTLALVERHMAGELHIDHAEGRLVGPLTLEGVDYHHDGTSARFKRVRFDWSPLALFAGTVRIDVLHVDGGRLTEAASAKSSKSSSTLPAPPLAVRLVDGRLSDITVVRAGSKPLDIKQLVLRGILRKDHLNIRRLAVTLPTVSAHVSGTVGLAAKVQTALDFGWQARLTNLPKAAGKGTLWGDFSRLHVSQNVTEPTAVQMKGTVEQPLKAPRWQLTVTVPPFQLAKVEPRWGKSRLAAKLEGHGTLSDVSIDGSLYTDADAKVLYPVHLSARLARAPGGVIRIARLSAKLPRQGASVDVNGEVTEATRGFDLHAGWKRLAWPLQGKPTFASAAGHADLKGTLAAYHLSAAASLQGKDIPAGQWQAQGKGDQQHFDIASVHGKLLKGSIDGSGMLAWKPKPAWKLNLAAKGIDPAGQWPDWPGEVAAHLQTHGQIHPDGVHGEAVLSDLRGKLRGYPLNGAAHIALAGKALDVKQLQIRSGKAQFSAQGKVAGQVALHWRLQAPQLNSLMPGWHGSLSGEGTVNGPRKTPRLAAKVNGAHLVGASVQADKLNADVDASLDPTQRSTVSLQAEGLKVYDRHFATATMKADGSEGSQRLSLSAKGADNVLDVRLSGKLQNKVWTGNLSEAHLKLAGIGDWTLVNPVALHADTHRRDIKSACWKNGDARLCLDADQVVGKQWTAKVAVDKLPVDELASTLPAAIQVKGTASARLQATRPVGKPLQADMTLSLSPGSVRYRASNGKEIPVDYGGGKLQARIDSKGLDASGAFRLQGTDRIDLDLHAPGFGTSESALRSQPMHGTVHAHIDKLGLLAALGTGIGAPAGAIDVNIKLGGTVAKPQLRGTAELKDGAFDMLALGVKVRKVSLTANAAPDGRVQFHGQATSGRGTVKIDGSGDIASAKQWHARLHLVGKDFEAADMSDAQLWVSPDLTLHVRPDHLDIKGKVTVPEAHIHPTQLASGTVNVSPDVVIVGANGKAVHKAPPMQVSTQVRLILGDKVDFKGFGLTGKLSGDLEVTDKPGSVTTGRGQVSINKGTYRAYGQDLTIQRGQFLFAGGPVDNPGINVRAVRTINASATTT